MPTSTARDQFPRMHARTQRFTLGRPRTFTVSPDGTRVWFLRSDHGDDGVHHLWLHDATTGSTTRLVDASALDVDEARLTPAERARRERAREGGGGIVGYATDHAACLATFVVGGRAFVVDATGQVVAVATDGPAHDPRLSADGSRLAVVVGRAVHATQIPLANDTAERPTLATDASPVASTVVGPDADDPATVSWGLAEFAAAEEMGRSRGFWLAPDGASMLVARVDESAVVEAWLADPVHPTTPPRPHRYPFAGTANATVDLHMVAMADRDGQVVATDVRPVTGQSDHYLAGVRWPVDGQPLLTWQDRSQTTMTITTLDPDRAVAVTRRRITRSPWVELVPGSPTWAGDRLVTVEARDDMGPGGTHAVMVDGSPLSPVGLQVRSVVDADEHRVVVTASRGDPTIVDVVAVGLADGTVTDMLAGPGVHAAVVGSTTTVAVATTMDSPAVATVTTSTTSTVIDDVSANPGIDVPVRLLELGPDRLHAGLVVPDGDGPFPVMLDPYGGPHAQRVLRARNMWLVAQWFASHGIAVLVTDNRGSPGRSPAFEDAVHGDLATGVLADQVAALEAAVDLEPRLDPTRVGIRGWSFGGYLAALAAVRRPDVFRAAIVGAPVTDWRLYDTHYTERYLGHPDTAGGAYTASSLVDPDGALVDAAPTDDPPAMLLIHGLVDDNVVAAHSLRLSRALLEAGRPHQFLPLSGVTHMTPQEEVAANLLTGQLAFLQEALGT